jgi:transposase
MVDTLGLVLNVLVHPAHVQDRDGAVLLTEQRKCCLPRLRTLFADGGYAGQLVEWFQETVGWTLRIVKRTANAGFEVLPKRWSGPSPGSASIAVLAATTKSCLKAANP